MSAGLTKRDSRSRRGESGAGVRAPSRVQGKDKPPHELRPAADPPEREELISRVKARVESLSRRSLELKAELDRLTTATFGELFEVTELRDAGKRKILVVDDDPTTVKIITHFLEQANFSVSSSLSGVEGLKRAFREFPDLIILDIMMPDLNGFQFLSIYREDGEGREIPVVILSSLAEEADVLKGLDLGAVDYITKPFSPQVLVAKVKKNLGARP